MITTTAKVCRAGRGRKLQYYRSAFLGCPVALMNGLAKFCIGIVEEVAFEGQLEGREMCGLVY